jgi:hypothetical protein
MPSVVATINDDLETDPDREIRRRFFMSSALPVRCSAVRRWLLSNRLFVR